MKQALTGLPRRDADRRSKLARLTVAPPSVDTLARGEQSTLGMLLVCLAYNFRRLHTLAAAHRSKYL